MRTARSLTVSRSIRCKRTDGVPCTPTITHTLCHGSPLPCMPLCHTCSPPRTLWIRNFQWLIFFVYIFLSMLSGDFLLCQTFWSKYLWIFLAIYVDYSYFDAQVRCTYLVPNMTLTLMFNRNYNNLRYSIKKNKVTFRVKILFIKISLWIFPKTLTIKITNWLHEIYLWVMLSQLVKMDFQISKLFS